MTDKKKENSSMKLMLQGAVGLTVVVCIAATLFFYPEQMGPLYTLLAVPLLTARYFIYRQMKEHFFLLDFCYYVQLNLLLLLWYYGPYTNSLLFAVNYVLTAGPLGGGVFMWKNALVLHDIDRFTSVFIHLVPPLVMYQLRWQPGDEGRQFFSSLAWPPLSAVLACALVAYAFWQAMYILKTEIIDRKRFREDPTLITSLRWMTMVKPHGIYVWLKSHGYNLPPLLIIVVVQLLYTLATVVPAALLLLHWQRAMELWLLFLLCVAVRNGFNLERERLRRQQANRTSTKRPPAADKLLRISSSRSRFFGAVAFILLVLGGNKFLVEHVVINNALGLAV